jgi:hypothetical protein
MADLSPFGVAASAGTLRTGVGVNLAHTWTPDGIDAAPASNGAQVLHLAVAVCILNDTFREAKELGIPVDGVAVTADGGYDSDWRSIGIRYSLTIDSPASSGDLGRLIALVDDVAEIPRALRAGTEVRRVSAEGPDAPTA